MKLVKARITKKKYDPDVITWAGLNQNSLIGDNQLSSVTNCSTKNFPLLSPRPSRTDAVTLTGTGYAIFAANDTIYWVDGTSFKENGTTKGTVTASSKSMVDFNGCVGIFPDKKYYDYVEDSFATMLGECQLLNYGFDSNGDVDYTLDTKIRSKNIISCTPSTAYTLANDKSYTVANAYYYDVNLNFISTAQVDFASFTTPATCYYFNFDITGTDLTCSVSITNAVWPSETAIPAIDYACTCNNRVWAVEGDNIYACALGDINDWTTFTIPTGSSDAWHTDTGTGGDFTGIVTYRNTVYFFKKDAMFKLYGNTANNFEVVRINGVGCISSKSIVEVNETLYFLNKDGIYMYQTGLPELISDDLNETYTSATAGRDFKRYYISLYNGSTYSLYSYDTKLGIWMEEDASNITEFCYQYPAAVPNGYTTVLKSDNHIYVYNLGSETVTMTVYTKEWTESSFDGKNIFEINIRADLETSTTLTVSTRVNNGSWVAVKTAYATTDLNSLRIPINVNRADHFQLKFVMVGEGKIYGVERTMTVGGKV